RTGTVPMAGGVWGFTDIELDEGRTRLEIERAKAGAPLAQLLPSGGFAVVNGGYFEADFRPSTWLKNDGVELSPKSDTSKGGVLAIGEGAVFVGPFSALRFEPSLAVQSFPLLVEPDYRSGIYRDDGRRAARTVACLAPRALRFIVIAAPRGEGPTLFEAAGLLRAPAPLGFGCRVALNLDGGPSTGVWFAPSINARQRPPLANVGYAIAILPR
ncbi:MAG TPA: phosphodiester glycosidase family protein, partial [Polyangiaceae bacterium]|nr:phosphodiester glycosidase family protein [Polyangiaceae bacterium]